MAGGILGIRWVVIDDDIDQPLSAFKSGAKAKAFIKENNLENTYIYDLESGNVHRTTNNGKTFKIERRNAAIRRKVVARLTSDRIFGRAAKIGLEK